MNTSTCRSAIALVLLGLLAACSHSDQGADEAIPEDSAAMQAVDAPAAKSEAPTAQATAQPDQKLPESPPPPATAPAPHASNAAGQAQLATQAEAQMGPSDAPGAAAMSPAAAAAERTVAHSMANAPAISRAESEVKQPVNGAAVVASTAPATAVTSERFKHLIALTASPALLSKLDSPREPPKTMSMMMGDIGISNLDDSSPVYFALKTHDSDWKDASVDPRITEEFGCGLVDECLFWMRTGTNPAVFYKLRSPERYALFWNEPSAIWDLRVVKRDGN